MSIRSQTRQSLRSPRPAQTVLGVTSEAPVFEPAPPPAMAFRYLGNKSRIVDWVIGRIRAVIPAGARVADPMCGTATVSRALADAGYVVTAADELTFPTLHAQARLLPSSRWDFRPFASSYEDALGQLNSLPPKRGFFYREYSSEGRPQNGCRPRAYFTGENAARVDAVRSQIRAWQQEGLSRPSVDQLLHDLILAVNVVANIAGTYGYYRSSWNSRSLSRLELRPSPRVLASAPHQVVRGKLEELAPSLRVDACYLDPPYTKRQYGGNYHIPETLARQDEPEPVGEGGLRDWYGEYSNFCSKVYAPDAFRKVLAGLDVEVVFVSYSEDGVVPPKVLRELLGEFGSVSRLDMPLRRYRSNGGGKGGAVTEHLYVLKKR